MIGDEAILNCKDIAWLFKIQYHLAELELVVAFALN